MAKIILGFTGEISSGKGTAAKYLAEKYAGSTHRFSTALRDVLDRIYLEQTRENLQHLSTILRQAFGEDILAKVIFNDAQNDSKDIIIIDGVRRINDIAYLKTLPHFKLVYIETSLEKRYERIVSRGENADDARKTIEEFKKDQEQEAESQICELKDKADFVVNNDGTFEDLYAQIDKIITDYKK